MQNTTRRPHICMFSQTGSEIANLIEQYGITPDLVLTNERPAHLRTIDSRIVGLVRYMPNMPTPQDYISFFKDYNNPIVTLHGWLRVVPPDICSAYEIYNGHPGLITLDGPTNEDGKPVLRGKDPQEKAYNLQLPQSGCVIHKVTEGVDEGEILQYKKISIKGLTLEEIFLNLRDCSLELWADFLQKDELWQVR